MIMLLVAPVISKFFFYMYVNIKNKIIWQIKPTNGLPVLSLNLHVTIFFIVKKKNVSVIILLTIHCESQKYFFFLDTNK